ncbi:hypothetical protein [Clostridium felsineum]|uniref:Uncharacterized protein n=1 Tax=Clostridium felsineum TaxID=36839 RepID=A0A1S8KZZ3_9CLOT|nr:hypothetical protein [Clostridium felsineum]URZ06464.1 hypothetical protein CLROS_017970 [Clostridium felsineum]URZ11499.1 hypothetical protein CROST_022160 [Clostridium felsineum]
MKVMIMAFRKNSWYGTIGFVGKHYAVLSQDNYSYKVKVGKEVKNVNKCDAVVI